MLNHLPSLRVLSQQEGVPQGEILGRALGIYEYAHDCEKYDLVLAMVTPDGEVIQHIPLR